MLVFLGCGFFHTCLIAAAIGYRDRDLHLDFQEAFFASPRIAIFFITVTALGTILSYVFIWHTIGNPRLSKRQRNYWLLAVVIGYGYGLIFYWYHYLLSRKPSKQAGP